MTAKHCPPSAAIISEHREGPVEAEVGTSNGAGHIHSHRSDRLSHTQLKRSSHEYNMPSSRGNTSRERSGRSQRAMTVTETNGHNAIKRKNNIIVRRTNSISSGEIAPREYTLSRPRRRQSNKDAEYSSSSSSSSSEGEEEEHREHIKDPKRPVAAPITGKEKLTSPSSLSTATAVTNGSTESSSTLKPESAATRPLALRKQAHVEEAPPTPISPAVPDAPDVFSFLAADSDGDDSPQDQPVDPMVESQWLPPKAEDSKSVGSRDSDKHSERAAGSSVTSSFHSDTFSDPIADNDTDRSSSPDMSVKGRRDSQYSRDSHRSHGTHERHEHHESKHPRDLPDLGTKSNCSSPTDAPKDGVSAKLASQIAAANKRQNRLKAAQPLGIPITPWMPRMHDMPQATPAFPPVPPMALAPQYYPSPQPGPRRAGSLPVTGYELLAARLSSHASTAESEGAPKIKPMYRKFEALNHRVLLHLQDELSELEEHLHQLDMADTQSRCIDRSQILPASRRASVQPGGELEYRKAEILGRIGYKLAQYSKSYCPFYLNIYLRPSSNNAKTNF